MESEFFDGTPERGDGAFNPEVALYFCDGKCETGNATLWDVRVEKPNQRIPREGFIGKLLNMIDGGCIQPLTKAEFKRRYVEVKDVKKA